MARAREDRQKRLAEEWEFNCSCSLCSGALAAAQASDERRRAIEDAKEALSSATSDPRKVLHYATRVVLLYEQEGLIAPQARYHEIAAYAANMIGDAEEARRYAQLAASHWAIVAGQKSWEARRMEEMAEDPVRHPSWRKLQNDDGGGKGQVQL